MTKFAYNNAKHANTGHTLFELNYGYYPRILFKEDTDPCSKLKQLTSYWQSNKSWWSFTKRTSTMLKSFKNKVTISACSLEAI